jgi:hypothetical protein
VRVLAALAPEVQRIWWITLGVGLVVALVVVALLQFLLRAVERIERNVVELWQTATTVARNTATTWLLGETAGTLDEIRAEALRHDALLTPAAGALPDGAGPPSDRTSSPRPEGP